MPTPEPPKLPGLELLRPIGRGSFGEVWLARTVTGQYRAVKIIWLRRPGEAADHPELQALGERVFRGVQAYLDHLPPGSPTGLAVLHVDRDPDGRFFYYVMELADDAVSGREFDPARYQALTLSEFRRRSPGQFVTADETIRLGCKLAEGLAALHAAGLVHRDIKPNNVVFIGGEPRLADIDLVRPAEASLSLGGAQGYSPLEGPGRPAADVFSLGRTLYATVTGLPVGEFPCLPEDWDQRPDAPDLQRLNAVLLRACDPNPARRHPNAAELALDFKRLEQGEDVERERAKRIRSRRLSVAHVVLVGLFLSVTAAGIPLLRAKWKRAEFVSHRMQMQRVAFDLEHGEPALAARSLTSALAASARPMLEADLLRRQIADYRTTNEYTNPLWIRTLGSHSEIRRIAFSADGKLLAVSLGMSIQVYSLPKGDCVGTIAGASELIGFLGAGMHLAGIARDQDGAASVTVWDSITGQPLPYQFKGDWSQGAVSDDGQTILVFSRIHVLEQ
jgi:serine/threonine protein kinase